MNYSFVSLLATDSFLPGVIALNNSLKKHKHRYGLLVLTTDLVSAATLKKLNKHQIPHRHVERVSNPNLLGEDRRNFKHMYTKLRIFEQDDFDKLVYIDADMLVCCNVDELFDCPHMSAVVAGALHPNNADWVHFNAGFLVVEPSRALAQKMYNLIETTPSNDGSDQGFLQSFYADWPEQASLHLDQKYNVPVFMLDVYAQHGYGFSYQNGKLDTKISILHYWDYHKPWDFAGKKLSARSPNKLDQAYLLWWDTYKPATKRLRAIYQIKNAIAGRLSALIKHKHS